VSCFHLLSSKLPKVYFFPKDCELSGLFIHGQLSPTSLVFLDLKISFVFCCIVIELDKFYGVFFIIILFHLFYSKEKMTDV